MVGGDKELLDELLNMFIADYPKKIEEIEKAIKNKNFEMLREIAHSLKGASGNLGLTEIYELCLKLENMGKEKDLSNAEDVLDRLKEELSKLRRILK